MPEIPPVVPTEVPSRDELKVYLNEMFDQDRFLAAIVRRPDERLDILLCGPPSRQTAGALIRLAERYAALCEEWDRAGVQS